MYKKNFSLKHRSNLNGFSLMELMVVVAIIAILAMMAMPLFGELMSGQQLRSAATAAAGTTQQARLRAANTQKPIRVVMDCSAFNPVNDVRCVMSMDTAIYTAGAVTGWTPVPSTRQEFSRNVLAVIADNPENDGGNDLADNIFWAIFMPSGEVFSYPRPFNLFFAYFQPSDTATPAATYRADPKTWLLDVNNITGRTIVNKANP